MIAQDRESAPLAIQLFGPFAVRLQGQPLPSLRSRKGQWLLALLALRHGREVARDWLADTLWPDSDQPEAFRSLRVSVADLRRALGEQAARLFSPTTRTLCLDLTDVEVDVLAFDAAIAAGSPASFEQAVALYRGPLLEGCGEEWILPERTAREQAYLEALMRLAAQAMTSGDPVRAVGYLRRVVAADPLQEAAQRALMEALAAAGDYAAVVEVYRDLRLYLHRHLNAAPDAQTTALFERLRSRARQQAQGTPSPEPSGASALPSRSLPRPLTALIGREQAVEEIIAILRRVRLVTVTGTGGVGKTRLAIAVAEATADMYPEGAFFVDLAALNDGVLVEQAVASVFGVREEPGRAVAETLQDCLRSKSALLILDNCEHLLTACARLASRLLAGSAHLRIVATSRQSLGITGELAWRAPSLSLPSPEDFGFSMLDFGLAAGKSTMHDPQSTMEKGLVSRLMEYEAIRLFVDRAALVQPSFGVTTQNAPAVMHICVRLDGIPLAIELAAARVKALPVEQIAARLDDRFKLLTGGSRTALPRQQTLRAAIDWSYDLLDEPERLLLHRLSVFVGGCTLDASEAICTGDVDRIHPSSLAGSSLRMRAVQAPPLQALVLHPSDALDVLTSLVDKSLVTYEEQAGQARYSLLETVRQYAQDRLREDGMEHALRQRHRDYFLQLAEEAVPKLDGPEQVQWIHCLEAEHDNLRTALQQCLDEKDEGGGMKDESRPFSPLHPFPALRHSGRASLAPSPLHPSEAGLRLAGALWRFWWVRGYFTEGREWLNRLLERRQETSTATQARALSAAGALAVEQGDCTAACAFYAEGLALYRKLEDKFGVCSVFNNLGIAERKQGNYTAARAAFGESIQLLREIGNMRSLAGTLHNLANVAHDQGDSAAARALYEEALLINREQGNRTWEANNLTGLGTVAESEGDYKQARAFLQQSLTLKRELGHRLGIANSLSSLGRLACDEQDYAEGRAFQEESLAIRRELGDTPGIAESLEEFARLAAVQGRVKRAVFLWAAAEGLREATHSAVPPAYQPEHDRSIAGARTALGEKAFAAAWVAGSTLTLEQVVEYALQDRE